MTLAKILGFWIGFALLFGALFLLGRMADKTARKTADGEKDAAAPAERKGGLA